jgi:hypothetical protein
MIDVTNEILDRVRSAPEDHCQHEGHSGQDVAHGAPERRPGELQPGIVEVLVDHRPAQPHVRVSDGDKRRHQQVAGAGTETWDTTNPSRARTKICQKMDHVILGLTFLHPFNFIVVSVNNSSFAIFDQMHTN